jgi:DNA recombination protein RmuC
MGIVTFLIVVLVAALAAALGYLLGARQRPGGSSAQQFDAAISASQRAVAPVSQSLSVIGAQLRELEASRAATDAQLGSLHRETAALVTALRRPQVRGRWGEMQLRRTVELAGMLAKCDFDEQVSSRSEEGLRRPDMVVHLAGNKQIVVDSKVPLDAFLDAAASSGDESDLHAERHLKQVRSHIDQLSAKAYWSQFDAAPEFVVMFLPGEAFLSAALERDPTLIDHAAQRKVVLATPTTLIAMLRTVAHAWTTESLAENAREIVRAGRELHDRIGAVASHFDKLGSALDKAVKSYNDGIGSLETRLLVTARRLTSLDVSDRAPETPKLLETTPRVMTAPELRNELPS